MPWFLAFLLAFGIFPSFTALSEGLQRSIPGVIRWTGPINTLKLGAPFLLLYVWSLRNQIPEKLQKILLGALAIGTLATIMAAVPCSGQNTSLIREWSVILMGMVGAAELTLLPRPQALGILGFWLAAIYGSTLLDVVAPSSVTWLYNHFFDPQTRIWDLQETGRRVLTGVFGKQSLAKLLAWAPWLALAFAFEKQPSFHKTHRRWFFGLLGLGMVSGGIILATSQRGPFVGAIAGWVVFAAHLGIRTGRKKLAMVGLAAVPICIVLAVLLVPRDLLKTRIQGMLSRSQNHANVYERIAEGHRDYRFTMFQLSAEVIRENPLGNACLPYGAFSKYGLHQAHSHHLFVQQFRERGWIWGAVHLGLWLLALAGAWRQKTLGGATLAAGIATVIVLGQFDHPWFVLNHAIMMSLFLFLGLRKWVVRA